MVISIGVQAQETEPFLHQKSYGFGLAVRSNGVGVSFQKQTNSSNQLNRFYYADFGTFKHTNESKIVNHKVENKMPYVYGKLFHTAVTRGIVGADVDLVKAHRYNTVSVNVQTGIGLTMAAQRPVYLRIETIENDQKTVKNVKYTREAVPTAEHIIGYAKNGNGWDELTYRPGIAGMFNMAFTWNDYAQVSKRVNVGATLDYYPNGLPIMSIAPNPKLNATFFVGFMWVLNQG